MSGFRRFRKAFLPVPGNATRAMKFSEGSSIKPGDHVFLVTCQDLVTGDCIEDVWLANKQNSSWEDFVKPALAEQQGIRFELAGEGSVKVDAASRLYVNVEDKPKSKRLTNALDAVSNLLSYIPEDQKH